VGRTCHKDDYIWHTIHYPGSQKISSSFSHFETCLPFSILGTSFTMATEKFTASTTEDVEASHLRHHDHGTGSSDGEYESEFTPKEQKAIIHRIDRRLVVTVGALYCISLMDRTNLSSAAIAG
jgi:hypothetical protein